MDIIIADTRTGNTAYIKDGSLITEPDMSITLEMTKRLSKSGKPTCVIGSVEIYACNEHKAAVNVQALSKRTARLIERGKLQDVISLLNSFGVSSVVQLKHADYKAYADKLTKIGG